MRKEIRYISTLTDSRGFNTDFQYWPQKSVNVVERNVKKLYTYCIFRDSIMNAEYLTISKTNSSGTPISEEKKIDIKDLIHLWDITPFAIAVFKGKYEEAEKIIMEGYIPSDYIDFESIKNKNERESLKTHFMNLVAQVQEHKKCLTEETEAASQEFASADEIIEM